MSIGHLLRPPQRSGSLGGYRVAGQSKAKEFRCARSLSLSSCAMQRDLFLLVAPTQVAEPLVYVSSKRRPCRCFAVPSHVDGVVKLANLVLARSHDIWHRSPLLFQLVPAFGIVAFSLWGFEPVLRLCRNLFLHRNDGNWKKSRTYHVFSSYMQPVLLWTGVALICRAIDPISLTSEAGQAVKQRLLNFIRSLSTVLTFAFCTSSLIQNIQKLYREQTPTNDTRSMGIQFVGKAIYTAMWVASISLFMELLGFSTQKWLTAGGLGTVLITLSGREIFTNFLSSLMIHATRPFIVNDWIQTKIEGYDVSGTVEHVGWWSPTIIRAEDQEAVHIPNHKFTVNVVRNLSQKTHWRIKTHLAISHLDGNKISNIVADMRKVLGKTPQIEQQKIHRRIFLDYIDTENQAFMILVSCFVRTSHFEEYLCVKETVLLSLLRVIHHHGAHLATPIRTIQKSYGDVNLEDILSADNTIFTRGRRALYLLDTSSRIHSDDKPKSRSVMNKSEEKPSKVVGESEGRAADILLEESTMVSTDKKNVANSEKKFSNITPNDDESQNKATKGIASAIKEKASVPHMDGLNDIPQISLLAKQEMESANGTPNIPSQSRLETEGTCMKPLPSTTKQLEQNIILGVALDGAKRTLPIEEEVIPPPENTKELVACKSGNETPLQMNKKDAETTAGSVLVDQDRGREKIEKASP